MPLNTTPKAGSANSNTPSRVITRQEVSMGKPAASTARVTALKAKLLGQPAPTQPVTPRPLRSSARQEEMANLPKYNTPLSPKPPALKQNTSARTSPTDLASIEPPPSGLVGQPHNSVEPVSTKPEATSAPIDPQLDSLARKERQLRRAQQEFKVAQEAWKQEQANYVPKARLTSETLKVLAEAGITSDKLVELQLNQVPKDHNQVLLDKISQLEDQLKGITDPEKGVFAQRDERDYNYAVDAIRNDAKLLVDSSPTYGTIKSEGKTEDVVNLITKVFDSEGVFLDVEEAAKLVEDKLVDRLAKDYQRLSKLDKIRVKIGQATETSPEATPPQQTAPKQTTTLTNSGSKMPELSPRDRAVLRVQEQLDTIKRRS